MTLKTVSISFINYQKNLEILFTYAVISQIWSELLKKKEVHRPIFVA